MKAYIHSLPCIHNQGTSYTSGRQCDDCGMFVIKGTLEYFMTVGWLKISMAIHNKKVSYQRGECGPISHDLLNIYKKLNDRMYMRCLNEECAKQFMNKVYEVLKLNSMTDEDASVKIKTNL